MDTFRELLLHGTPIVGTCEELLWPWLRHPVLAQELHELALKNGGRVLGTGVNPGFLMDSLPVALSTACRRVRSVQVERIQDATSRRVPFQEKIGAGLSPEEFAKRVANGTLRHVGLGESLHFVAHYLRIELEHWEESIEPVLATVPLDCALGPIQPGDACGVRQVARGLASERVALELVFQAAIGQADPVDRIEIEGEPGLKMLIPGGVHGDVATSGDRPQLHPLLARGAARAAHHGYASVAGLRSRNRRDPALSSVGIGQKDAYPVPSDVRPPKDVHRMGSCRPHPYALRRVSAALGVVLIASAFSPLQAQRSARVRRVETPPVIDGRLEDVWNRADPIGELVQVKPVEGADPSERSVIRILFDADHLYFGMRFYDGNPAGIISTTHERDANLDVDDRIEIVIDTFHDRRNAFFFQINAAGSKGDGLITEGGSQFNKPWDRIWDGPGTHRCGGLVGRDRDPLQDAQLQEGRRGVGLQSGAVHRTPQRIGALVPGRPGQPAVPHREGG